MAEVPVTINGVICDLYGRTIMGPVKIVGSLVRTDVGVGGGPIYPPEGGGEQPPDSGLHPEHPIYYPPGTGPSEPRPEHPIVLPPDPPTEPPTEPPTNPPDPQWVWGFSPTLNRWVRVFVPGPGQPGPKG